MATVCLSSPSFYTYIVPLLENYAFDVLYKVYSYSFASIFSAIENIFKLKGKTQP